MTALQPRIVEARLLSTTRRRNSVNGNARFTLVTTRGNFDTATDSFAAAEVQNITHSNGSWDGDPEPIRVTFHVNRRGTVDSITERTGT